MPTKKPTALAIDALPRLWAEADRSEGAPRRRTASFADGFVCRGGAKTARSFALAYRLPGDRKKRWLTFGTYVADDAARGISLRDAMAQHARALATLREGKDPQTEFANQREASRLSLAAVVQAKQQSDTFEALFNQWKDAALTHRPPRGGRPQGRKDNGEELAGHFRRHVFPRIGSMPAKEVEQADLLRVLDPMRKKGPYRVADMLVTALKQMCRWARARNYLDRNPAEMLSIKEHGGYAVAPRDRELSAVLPDLAAALPAAGLPKRTEHAVWLMLATMLRVDSELRLARWSHIDLESRTWTVPVTKNLDPHRVHLSDFALRHLRALQELAVVGCDYVFPNRAGTGPIAALSITKQLADRQRVKVVRNRTKQSGALVLPGGRWTSHDLRRTGSTVMGDLGVDEGVIDRCMNHRPAGLVRRTYQRSKRTEQCIDAWNRLGAYLDGIEASSISYR